MNNQIEIWTIRSKYVGNIPFLKNVSLKWKFAILTGPYCTICGVGLDSLTYMNDLLCQLPAFSATVLWNYSDYFLDNDDVALIMMKCLIIHLLNCKKGLMYFTYRPLDEQCVWLISNGS